MPIKKDIGDFGDKDGFLLIMRDTKWFEWLIGIIGSWRD